MTGSSRLRGAWTRASGSAPSVRMVTPAGAMTSLTWRVASKSSSARDVHLDGRRQVVRQRADADGLALVQQRAAQLLDGIRLAHERDGHVDGHLLGHLDHEEVGVDGHPLHGVLGDVLEEHRACTRRLPTLRSRSALRPACRRSVSNSLASSWMGSERGRGRTPRRAGCPARRRVATFLPMMVRCSALRRGRVRGAHGAMTSRRGGWAIRRRGSAHGTSSMGTRRPVRDAAS